MIPKHYLHYLAALPEHLEAASAGSVCCKAYEIIEWPEQQVPCADLIPRFQGEGAMHAWQHVLCTRQHSSLPYSILAAASRSHPLRHRRDTVPVALDATAVAPRERVGSQTLCEPTRVLWMHQHVCSGCSESSPARHRVRAVETSDSPNRTGGDVRVT